MASKTELSIILKAVDAASGVFSKVDKQVTKLGKRAVAIGKKMTAGLTVPIVAMSAASVKAASEFEKGMSDVGTLIDTNVESLGDMSAKVLEMSTAADQAAVPIEDMTGALFDIRSAGIDAADAMDVLSAASKLGVAGLGSTKQAADLGTSAINAFGLKGERATRAFNTLFTATKFGKTTIAELSQGFGGVAGIVAENNISLEEFAATTAALTTTGLKASEAYTQQKAILAGLTRQTDETRKVFRKLGVKDFKQLIDESDSFQEAISKVAAAVGRNDTKLLKLVGSTEALNAILALSGKQADTAIEALDDMTLSSGNLQEAFEKQNDTTTAGLQRTKNAINAAAISMGTILAPVVTKVSGFIGDAAKAFQGLDEDTKETIVTIGAAVAATGPIFIAVGKLMGILSAIGGKKLLLLGVGTAAFKVGQQFDEWFDISTKLADVIEQIVEAVKDFEKIAKALGPRRLVRGVSLQVPPEIQAAIDAQQAGEDPQAALRAARIQRAQKLATSVLGPSRAAELIEGLPGQGGQGGTVKIEIANAPRGTTVEQTEGDPIDLQVGRQLAVP